MKRIIGSVFELLFVLVVFFDPSVANPPGGGSSSSKTSKPRIYDLNSVRRVGSTVHKSWQNPRIHIENYDNAAKFKYKLLGANDEVAYENTGRKTNLVFFNEKKMTITAADNHNVYYSLDFKEDNEANSVADYMLSADSARFKKCTGSDTFKLDKLYKASPGGDYDDDTLFEVAGQWCIFKIPRTENMTTFVIRRTEPAEDGPLTLCVFRWRASELIPSGPGSKQLSLRLNWHAQIVEPIYVLKTSNTDELRDFIRSGHN